MSKYTEEEEAEIIAEREREIDRLRDVLGTALSDAHESLHVAIDAVAQLVSNQVYDIEYAESAYGTYLKTMLDDAVRTVRIAALVKKQLDS